MKLTLGLLYIGFGFFIDFLQFVLAGSFVALGTGLEILTPVGGGVVGAGTGCSIGWSLATNVLTGVVGCIKGGVIGLFGGALASTFGPAFGGALAYIIEVCISLSFGTLLVTLLWFSGMFSSRAIFITFLSELSPINIFPGWGFGTLRCVRKYYAKKAARAAEHKMTPANDNYPPREYEMAA